MPGPEENPLAALLALLRGQGTGAVLARGAGWALAIRVASSGIGFGVQILLARLLGAEQFGTYIYALTWITFLAMPAQLGFHTATVRFVAAYRSLCQWELLRGYLRRVHQIVFLTSLWIAVLVFGLVQPLRSWLGDDLTLAFEVACLLIPALAPLHIHAATLRGLKQIVLALTPMEIVRPVLLAAGLLTLFALSSTRPAAATALAINVAATLIALILAAVALRRCLPAEVYGQPARYRSREWVRVALPLSLITGFAQVLAEIDIVMVGAFLDPTEAGIYAPASRIAGLLSFGLIAVGTIAAPLIGELHAQGRQKELQRVLTLGSRAALAFALPASVALAVSGRFLLGLFGPGFVQAYPSLLILAISQLVNTAMGSVVFLMVMTGDQNRAAKTLGAGAVLDVALNALLVPIFGISGGAIAAAVANISCRVMMVRFVIRHRNLDPTPFRRTDSLACRSYIDS